MKEVRPLPHLTAEQLDRYLGRALPPDQIVALHGHLAACAECRLAVRQAAEQRLDSGSPAHPDVHLHEREMVAWVAGRMSEGARSATREHLDRCTLCRDSVEAMEAERDNSPKASPFQSDTRVRSIAGWIYAAAGIAASLLLFWAVRHMSTRPAAETAVLIDSGVPLRLNSQGAVLGLADASDAERNEVSALKLRSLPAVAAFAAEPGAALRAPDSSPTPAFAPIAPLNIRVLTDRPVFSWSPLENAAGYEVVVTDESLAPLARSGAIQATTWRPETSLPRGRTLLWQIRATRGGQDVGAPAPPAPMARFGIASAELAARIAKIQASAHPSHLLMAVILARAGLLDDARTQLELLAPENPASPLVPAFEKSLTKFP